MAQILINDKFTFTYNSMLYMGKIIYYNNIFFITVTSNKYNRMVFELVMAEDYKYSIKLVFITTTHEINRLKKNKIIFYNSNEYQNKLLTDTTNYSVDNFSSILNEFVLQYLHKKNVDDIFLNIIYFYCTNYNRTYLLCLCAVNNDMNNFYIILNNIQVNYNDLIYTLNHTFGYLPISLYSNKEMHLLYIQQLHYLKYLPEYSYLTYPEFIKLIYSITQHCTLEAF